MIFSNFTTPNKIFDSELELENRRLQKALDTETLRAKAFDTMIELAESKFNIPIRKKSGTKR